MTKIENRKLSKDTYKVVFPNSDVYEGELKDNKVSGYGKLTLFNGNVFEGNFVDGELNGYGVF